MTVACEVTEFVENERIRVVAEGHSGVEDTLFVVRPIDSQAELTISLDVRARSLLDRIRILSMGGEFRKSVENAEYFVTEHCEGRGQANRLVWLHQEACEELLQDRLGFRRFWIAARVSSWILMVLVPCLVVLGVRRLPLDLPPGFVVLISAAMLIVAFLVFGFAKLVLGDGARANLPDLDLTIRCLRSVVEPDSIKALSEALRQGFILYLRGFTRHDPYSMDREPYRSGLKEDFIRHLDDLLPVVYVGDKSTAVPDPEAIVVFFTDDTWPAAVADLVRSCTATFVNTGDRPFLAAEEGLETLDEGLREEYKMLFERQGGGGLLQEVELMQTEGPRERVVFLAQSDSLARELRQAGFVYVSTDADKAYRTLAKLVDSSEGASPTSAR